MEELANIDCLKNLIEYDKEGGIMDFTRFETELTLLQEHYQIII